MSTAPTGFFRLLLWPTVITAAISVARLVCEVRGVMTSQSGGAMLPLGITWCVFVFGAWLGWRLSSAGSKPRMANARSFAAVLMLVLIGAGAWQFAPLLDAPANDETFMKLRAAVLILASITGTLAVFALFLWPRLALTMLAYAIPARATTFGFAWLAKSQGWNTHYTKIGPQAFERDMSETLLATAIAQFGFWVPFTVVGGVLAGVLFARRK